MSDSDPLRPYTFIIGFGFHWSGTIGGTLPSRFTALAERMLLQERRLLSQSTSRPVELEPAFELQLRLNQLRYITRRSQIILIMSSTVEASLHKLHREGLPAYLSDLYFEETKIPQLYPRSPVLSWERPPFTLLRSPSRGLAYLPDQREVARQHEDYSKFLLEALEGAMQTLSVQVGELTDLQKELKEAQESFMEDLRANADWARRVMLKEEQGGERPS